MDQVEDQWRGEGRVGPLPRKLEGHRGAEESVELDEVPGGLPVAKGRHVVDPDDYVRLIAEDRRDDLALRLELGRGDGWVGEGKAIRVTEHVEARPALHLKVAHAEHRRQRALEQGLAGLTVLASMRGAALAGERLKGGQRGADRRHGSVAASWSSRSRTSWRLSGPASRHSAWADLIRGVPVTS